MGLASLLGAILMVASISCGDSFSRACAESRTCPAVGGQPSAGAGSDAIAGGAAVSAEGGATFAGGANDDDLPPTIVATTPNDAAMEVEPDATVVITFSEPLDPDTVNAASVQILDGKLVVPGTLAYADRTVTFTPSAPLALLVDYSLRVTTELTDAQGVALLEEHTGTFVTRDGAWHAVEIASGTDDELLPRSIPLAANGDTLLAWTLSLREGLCSTSVRWFNRGEPAGAAAAFATAQVDGCLEPSLDANSAGVAGLFSGAYTADHNFEITSVDATLREYRSGTWTSVAKVVSNAVAVGVAPNGAVAFLAQSYQSTQALMSGGLKELGGTHMPFSLPDIAFSANGDGFAAWAAQVPGTEVGTDGPDEVLVARYTPAEGWEAAVPLPGSVASVGGPNNERGTPAIAVDDAGGAMAVWVREANAVDSGALVASRYTTDGGWKAPVPLSGTAVVTNLAYPPGLVFDGDTYVAAWVGKAGGSVFPYTARYDIEAAQWGPHESRSDVAVTDSMPQLGSDAHHNLLLTWIAPSPKGASLAYARYSARPAEWSGPTPVPGGAVGGGRSSLRPSPLGVNAAGLGALVWGVASDFFEPATVHHASFH